MSKAKKAKKDQEYVVSFEWIYKQTCDVCIHLVDPDTAAKRKCYRCGLGGFIVNYRHGRCRMFQFFDE